ncbi:MAG: purine-binding chemotaxis protein CheW [Clostridiales bacterium]|nr:purine-binding chemotaxis protein CheW [Clostridiales bacterium]
MLKLVVFGLDNQFFGADSSQVFQIIRYQELTKVPRMPKFMEGIMDFRGNVLPVVSLSKRFELGEGNSINDKTKILVVSIGDKFAGFIVDDVHEIFTVDEEDIEQAPQMLMGDTYNYLKSIAKKGDKLISIIHM